TDNLCALKCSNAATRKPRDKSTILTPCQHLFIGNAFDEKTFETHMPSLSGNALVADAMQFVTGDRLRLSSHSFSHGNVRLEKTCAHFALLLAILDSSEILSIRCFCGEFSFSDRSF